MRRNLTCSYCGDEYKYTRSFCKHLDKKHPERSKEPMDLVFAFQSAKLLNAMNKEAEEILKNSGWNSDPQLRYSYKNGMMPT